MQDQRRGSTRQPGFVSPYFLPQVNNTSGSSSIMYSPRDQNSGSFTSFNSSGIQSPRRKVTLVPSPLVLEATPQIPQMPRKSFLVPMTESNSNLLGRPSLLINPSQNRSLMQLPLANLQRPSIRVVDPQLLVAQKRSSILLPPPSMTMLDAQPHSSGAGEIKLLKYFERQTLAMEKLAGRVEMQKREERDEKERIDKETKKYGALTERPRGATLVMDSPLSKKGNYDNSGLNSDRAVRHGQDSRTNNDEFVSLIKRMSDQPHQHQGDNSKYRSRDVIEEEDEKPEKSLLSATKAGLKTGAKGKTAALQALGELYLMGKLPGAKSEQNEKSSSAIWALVEEQLGKKIAKSKQKSSEEDLEDEDDEEEPQRKSPKLIGLSLSKTESQRQEPPKRERKYLQARRAGLPITSSTIKTDSSSDSDSSEDEQPAAKGSISPIGKNKPVKVVQFSPVIKPVKSQELSGDEEENQLTSDIEKSSSLKKKKKTLPPKSIIKPRKSIKSKTHISLTSVEDKPKQKGSRKQKIKQKLCALLWILAYPNLFSKSVEKETIRRKEVICRGMNTSIEAHFKNCEMYLIAGAEKYLKDLVSETKCMEMFVPGKTINDKILDVRANWILTNLKGLFDKLILRTTNDSLSESFLRFLVLVSEDYGVLPRDFMFDFEIKRLHFNCYGNLKNMTPAKSKMIIGSFILLRVLVHRIIMKPWTVFPDLKKNKINKGNLITIGSILYYLVINMYKKSTPICHNNQSFLPNHYKVKAKGIALKAVDDAEAKEEDEQPPKTNGGDKDYDAIKGFIPQEQLKSLFSDRRKLCEQLKALIEGWHDKIYELTHESYLQMPRQQMKKMHL